MLIAAAVRRDVSAYEFSAAFSAQASGASPFFRPSWLAAASFDTVFFLLLLLLLILLRCY